MSLERGKCQDQNCQWNPFLVLPCFIFLLILGSNIGWLIDSKYGTTNADTTGSVMSPKRKNCNNHTNMKNIDSLIVEDKFTPQGQLLLPPLQKLIPSYYKEYSKNTDKRIFKDISRTRKEEVLHQDVKRILYFTVLGFPKCGTSFLNRWFHSHPELLVPTEEYALSPNRDGEKSRLVAMLHQLSSLPRQKNISITTSTNTNTHNDTTEWWGKRGYKMPNQLYEYRSFGNMFQQYFPLTKLIVGVRHPVKWFESFYNFRLRSGKHLPSSLWHFVHHPSDCSYSGLCIERANFHSYLAMLLLGISNASTNLTDESIDHFPNNTKQTVGSDQKELALLRAHSTVFNDSLIASPRLSNPIFLFDISQLDSVQHNSTSQAVAMDLSKFLNLHQPFSISSTAGPRNHLVPSGVQLLDICNDEMDQAVNALRKQLLQIGKVASRWILNYFITLPRVTVSSPQILEQVLRSWGQDPCEG